MEVGKDHAKGRIEELAESGGRCLEDVAMIVGMDVNLDHENHGSDDDGTIQCSPVWTGGQMGDRKSVRNIQDDGCLAILVHYSYDFGKIIAFKQKHYIQRKILKNVLCLKISNHLA